VLLCGSRQFESLVAIDRNQWSPSIGITGRLQSEPVVAVTRCAQHRRWPRVLAPATTQFTTQLGGAGQYGQYNHPPCSVDTWRIPVTTHHGTGRRSLYYSAVPPVFRRLDLVVFRQHRECGLCFVNPVSAESLVAGSS
jgi:hypothetical protein